VAVDSRQSSRNKRGRDGEFVPPAAPLYVEFVLPADTPDPFNPHRIVLEHRTFLQELKVAGDVDDNKYYMYVTTKGAIVQNHPDVCDMIRCEDSFNLFLDQLRLLKDDTYSFHKVAIAEGDRSMYTACCCCHFDVFATARFR
jgi:hypothetical protein